MFGTRCPKLSEHHKHKHQQRPEHDESIAATSNGAKNSRHVLQKKKSLSQFIWNLHFKKNKIIAKFACHITTHGGYQWGWAVLVIHRGEFTVHPCDKLHCRARVLEPDSFPFNDRAS
jgi:hypothetical protein